MNHMLEYISSYVLVHLKGSLLFLCSIGMVIDAFSFVNAFSEKN